MRGIAWLFMGVFLLADLAPAQADEAPRGRGRAAKIRDASNSDRGLNKEFGFFFEPSVGFGYGKYSESSTDSNATPVSVTGTGPAFSGTFGAVYTSYFAGARANYHLISGTGLDGFKDLSVGVVAGLTLGSMPMRFYGAFNFIDNLTTASQTVSANSFVLGISYYFTQKFVANLEYHVRDFSRVSAGSAFIQPKFSNFVLSISLPFMFGCPSMPEMARWNAESLKEVGGSMGEWNL